MAHLDLAGPYAGTGLIVAGQWRWRTVAVLTCAKVALPALGLASFTSGPSQAMSVSAATLAAPTSVSAVRGQCNALTSVKVNLTWTASASSQTTGYEIFRSTTSGSGYSSVGTATGTSLTDSSVTFATRYYYVVKSSRNSWRSANSNEDAVTTPNSACIGGSDT